MVVAKRPAEEKHLESPKGDNNTRGVNASENEAGYPEDSLD
jgi:hypothetical protein